MKRRLSILMLILACVFVVSACTSNNADNNVGNGNIDEHEQSQGNEQDQSNEQEADSNEPDHELDVPEDEVVPEDEEPAELQPDDSGQTETPSTSELDSLVSDIMEAIEQRSMMELEADMIEDVYHLDPELLEAYAIHLPFFNISASEFAILKVKDEADVATVEEAVRKRAADVQKTFEQYLPDQYENSKNYKVVSKEGYVFFVIDNEETQTAMIQIFEDFVASK